MLIDRRVIDGEQPELVKVTCRPQYESQRSVISVLT